MKSKKNKAANKLRSLKEKELFTNIEENVLNEEIPFEDQAHNRVDVEKQKDDLSAIDTREQALRAYQRNFIQKIDSEAQDSNDEAPIRRDEGTVVLDKPKAENTDIAHEKHANETTYRDLTSGRSPVRDNERISYGDVYENKSMATGQNGPSVDGLLKQSEHLRIAQEKINELEKELDDLRKQNHELSSDAESIATLNEAYSGQIENLKMELTHVRLTLGEELKILRHSLHEKQHALSELKQSNSDLKSKVENNFKSIRKRERDLEYRLELAKVDEDALLKSKDKMILDLRREVDKKEQEKSAFERKNKEHYQKIQEQQQTVRTVVRALRIALTRLEGDFGVDFEVLKKAE